MGKYKAVFFDRDGTLVHGDPEWTTFRNRCLKEWSGKEFNNSYDYFMKIFNQVEQGDFPFAPYHTVEEELEFFRQWYLYVFDDMGITEKRRERADMLVEKLWYLEEDTLPGDGGGAVIFQAQGVQAGGHKRLRALIGDDFDGLRAAPVFYQLYRQLTGGRGQAGPHHL